MCYAIASASCCSPEVLAAETALQLAVAWLQMLTNLFGGLGAGGFGDGGAAFHACLSIFHVLLA